MTRSSRPTRISHRTRLPLLLLSAMLMGCGGGGGGGGSGGGNNATSDDNTDAAEPDATVLSADEGIRRSRILAAASPPAGFDAWEQQMVAYGHQWGQALIDETDFATQIDLQYYDAQRVHEQIAHYLGTTTPWRDYAQAGGAIYKEYLERADFRAAGHMRFPHGLYLDVRRNDDAESREYLVRLRDRPPFSWPGQADGEWDQQKYSREIAYSLESQILAERAGHDRQAERVEALAGIALTHVDIWVTGEYLDPDPGWHFCQAFMAGLSASALIAHHGRTVELGQPDERILPALEKLGDFLWETMWVPQVAGTDHGAFENVQPTTSGVGSETPAPDLNMLIAPMFGWLYHQTGDPRWLRRGDAVFAGGVGLANLNSGKRFNQNYRSSFDYLGWRTLGIERHGE